MIHFSSPRAIQPFPFASGKAGYSCSLQLKPVHPYRTICSAVESLVTTHEPLIHNVEYRDGTFSVSGTMNSEVPAEEIYRTLTDYDSLPEVFHNVDHCTVEQATDGTKRLVQMVSWKFLIFRGSFMTELKVLEIPENYELSFSLIDSAFMKDFIGTWNIEEDGSGLSVIRHSIAVNPTVSPPQRIGDITKKIFEAQVKGVLGDLAKELDSSLN